MITPNPGSWLVLQASLLTAGRQDGPRDRVCGRKRQSNTLDPDRRGFARTTRFGIGSGPDCSRSGLLETKMDSSVTWLETL